MSLALCAAGICDLLLTNRIWQSDVTPTVVSHDVSLYLSRLESSSPGLEEVNSHHVP